MLEQLKKLVKDEEAPTAVEYAIMVAGIAVAMITVVFMIGDQRRREVPGPSTPPSPALPGTKSAATVDESPTAVEYAIMVAGIAR